MNDMERRNFEDAMKDAFQGAEKSPTDNVWTNIELELERAETGKIKRRLLFYQILAAASVSFAVLMAGVGYYALNSNNTQSVIANNGQSQVKPENGAGNAGVQQPGGNDTAGNQLSENQAQGIESSDPSIIQENKTKGYAGASRAGQISNPSTSGNSGQHISNNEATSDFLMPHDANGLTQNDAAAIAGAEDNSDFLAQRQLPALYTLKPVTITITKEESIADPVALMMLQLADRERAMGEEKEKPNKINGESLWTSVGFSAGGYNAGHANISQNSAASNVNFANAVAFNNSVSNQTAASGVSYSFGMVVGKRLAGRWVIQSGLNYMNNSVDYTSNQVVRSQDFKNFKAATLSDLRSPAQADNTVLQNVAAHDVNSSLEYLSIPVQAGFIAVDHKIGVQFNAGVATDLFIQNTINPEGSAIETIQIERGSESIYRSTNFSGLLNTELSYRFASRYRLSLNPGLRYPFNSIFKDEWGISSTPLIFDVGVRFRYIFN
jgi:hypothetical protein